MSYGSFVTIDESVKHVDEETQREIESNPYLKAIIKSYKEAYEKHKQHQEE